MAVAAAGVGVAWAAHLEFEQLLIEVVDGGSLVAVSHVSLLRQLVAWQHCSNTQACAPAIRSPQPTVQHSAEGSV